MMLTHHGLGFLLHPQLWLVPLGLIVLIAEQLNRAVALRQRVWVEPCGGLEIELGNQGQLAELLFIWRRFDDGKLVRCAKPDEIIRAISAKGDEPVPVGKTTKPVREALLRDFRERR